MSELVSRHAAQAGRPLFAIPRAANWIAVLAVFAAGAVLRIFVPGNNNVSWLITAVEKMLAGARLYTDVIEVNPPATLYLYLPQTALAHALSLKPEWVVDASVFLAVALSLWFAARIVRANRLLPEAVSETAALTCMAIALVILPTRVFGEREHFALIAALPSIAVLTAVASGRKISLATEIVSGLGAGMMAIIKPYLALGIVFSALAAAMKARSWRPLFSMQNWCAAVICAAYVFWIWRAYPSFISEIVPFVADTYVPMRAPLWILVFRSGLVLWLLAIVLLYRFVRGRIFEPIYFVPLAASCGFALAYLMQGKLWPYQSYPALAVGCFLVGLGFLERFHGSLRAPGEERQRIVSACTVTVVAGASALWFHLALDFPDLRAAIRAIQPAPKIISLSDDLGLGFPLTRDVGGEWVGRKPSLWVTTFADNLRDSPDPAARARYSAYVKAERKMFAEDVIRGRPDIILWQRVPYINWLDWANADPELAAALKAYRPRETIGEVTILSRQ